MIDRQRAQIRHIRAGVNPHNPIAALRVVNIQRSYPTEGNRAAVKGDKQRRIQFDVIGILPLTPQRHRGGPGGG